MCIQVYTSLNSMHCTELTDWVRIRVELGLGITIPPYIITLTPPLLAIINLRPLLRVVPCPGNLRPPFGGLPGSSGSWRHGPRIIVFGVASSLVVLTPKSVCVCVQSHSNGSCTPLRHWRTLRSRNFCCETNSGRVPPIFIGIAPSADVIDDKTDAAYKHAQICSSLSVNMIFLIRLI